MWWTCSSPKWVRREMPSPSRGRDPPSGWSAGRKGLGFRGGAMRAPPLHRRGPVHVQRGTRWKRGVVKPARRSAVKPLSQVPHKTHSGAVVPRAATPQRGRRRSPASCKQTRGLRGCAIDARMLVVCAASPATESAAGRQGGFRPQRQPRRLDSIRPSRGMEAGRTRCPLNAGTVWSRGGCGSWQVPSRPHRNDGTRRAFGRRGGGAGST